MLRTTYKQARRFETVYTGGAIGLSQSPLVIATAREQEVVLISPETLQTTHVFPSDESDLTAIAVKPDGTGFSTSHTSHQIREWDLSSSSTEETTVHQTAFPEKPRRVWKVSGAFVATMCYDQTGTLLALGCTDTRVRVWECTHGYISHSLRVPNGGVVSVVAFCPGYPATIEKPLLVTAAEDNSVRIWDLADQDHQCFELRGHMSPVTSIAFANNGSVLISAGRDNVLNVWNMESKTLLKTIPVFESIAGIAVCQSLIPPSSKQQQQQQTSPKKSKRKSTATTTRSNEMIEVIIIAGSESGTLKALTTDGKELWKMNGAVGGGGGGGGNFTKLFNAGNSNVLAITEEQNLLFFPTKEIAYKLDKPRVIIGNRDQIADMQFLNNAGSHALVVDNSERPQIVDLSNGITTGLLEGHSDLVLCCAIRSFQVGDINDVVDNSGVQNMFIATGSKDKTARIWNASTGHCLGICEGHTDAITAIAFSNHSKKLITTGSDTTMKIWELPENFTDESASSQEPWKLERSKITVRAHEKDVNALAISPNDKFLATASQDKTVKLWQTDTLSLETTLLGHKRGVWAVCFSPVDKIVVSAGADSTIRIWNITNYSCIRTLEGHSGAVLRINFISNGLQLLSTGADSLIKLWTVKTSECITTLDGHSDKIWALAVANDGSDGGKFATAGSDACLVVWEDQTAEKTKEEKEMKLAKLKQEHELQAMMSNGQLHNALQAAFTLNHPRRILKILQAMIAKEKEKEEEEQEKTSDDGSTLKEIIKELPNENVRKLLWHCVDWNTSVKFFGTAQSILNEIFRSWPSEQLRLAVPDLGHALEALIPYTERHLKHSDALLQRSFILDYTKSTMSTVGSKQPHREEENQKMEEDS